MKDAYVRVRLTKVEKELFEANSKKLNMSISDYIKYCCLINPPNPYSFEGEEEYIINKK